jgi:hypothetical protein
MAVVMVVEMVVSIDEARAYVVPAVICRRCSVVLVVGVVMMGVSILAVNAAGASWLIDWR